jgi:hypothetical protein
MGSGNCADQYKDERIRGRRVRGVVWVWVKVMVAAMAESDESRSAIQSSEDEGETDLLTREDLQILAEKVFALIKEELWVERERLGYLERRGGRGGV